MARKCDICGRRPTMGFNVSHSHVRTKKVQGLNLKNKKIKISEKESKNLRVCSKCLKTHTKSSKINTFKG